jgi:hypothetical protein
VACPVEGDAVVGAGDADDVGRSTVTAFSKPDTAMLAQWPVITTMLETPLTIAAPSLHASILLYPSSDLLAILARGPPIPGCGTPGRPARSHVDARTSAGDCPTKRLLVSM